MRAPRRWARRCDSILLQWERGWSCLKDGRSRLCELIQLLRDNASSVQRTDSNVETGLIRDNQDEWLAASWTFRAKSPSLWRFQIEFVIAVRAGDRQDVTLSPRRPEHSA